jgi:uncharacterized damage-inducible protein DinB
MWDARLAMGARQRLAEEFDHEARVTRTLLERLPDQHWAWRPHAKSFSAGDLASHIVACLGWAAPILSTARYDIDPKTYRQFTAGSSAALLAGLDEAAAAGRAAFAAATDAALEEPWQLSIGGRPRWARPREVVLRDFTFSHLAHHRGQFSVYLRLLDLPVPGAYGPSADDAA